MSEVQIDPQGEENTEPRSERVTIDFQVHLAQPSRRLLVREGPAPLPPMQRGRLARVTRMLVQAHLFQRMLETGQARDLADLARRFRLTRARVTQISNYTLLAPDIQEEILDLPLVEPGKNPVPELRMREVLREVLWDEQRKRWRAVMKHRSLPDAAQDSQALAHRSGPRDDEPTRS